MTSGYGLLPVERAALHEEVGRRLAGSPAYRHLEEPTRQAVYESLTRIFGYLTSETAEGRPTAGQLTAAEALRASFEGAPDENRSGQDAVRPDSSVSAAAPPSSATPHSAPSAGSIGMPRQAG